MLFLRRVTPQTQLTDYVANDPFHAAAHEAALDKLTREVQDLTEEFSRRPALALTSPEHLRRLLFPAPRSLALLGWNANGSQLTLYDQPPLQASIDGTPPVDGTSLQALLDSAPTGSRITLGPGACLLTEPLRISRSMTLQGAGMNQSILLQTAAHQPVLIISAADVHVTGLTVSHSVLPVAGGDGLVVRGPGGIALSAVTLTDVMARYNWRGFVLAAVSYAQATQLWSANDSGFEFLYDALGGECCSGKFF